MQKYIDKRIYACYRGRIAIVSVAMIILPIIFCTASLACIIKVYKVSIYPGKTQEEACAKEYDGETMYIPIDSKAYFYAEIDDVCNPDWKDYEWQFNYNGDSSWDYDTLTYWLYCIPKDPPNPWAWIYDTGGWYYPKVDVGLEGLPRSHADDICQVAVVKVNSLEWQTYPGNTPLSGGKIFPGKKVYCDTHGDDRRKVKVKATLNMAPDASDNIYVYFQCWDVDDPSSNSAPIDEDDNDPDPNKHSIDNNGSFYFEDDDNTISVLADGSVVYATFLVSMNPGDNYRITATTSQEAKDELTYYKVETGNIPSSVKRTSILTTWRKLWIERDSMDTVADAGEEKNYVSGTASMYELISFPPAESRIYLGQNLPDELDDENQFYMGKYHALNNLNYTVFYSSGRMIGEDYLRVPGDPDGDNADMDYELFDDDYHPVTLQPNITLPTYPDLGSYTNEFKRAYIEPSYLPTSYSNVVDFDRNLSYFCFTTGWGDWNDHFNNPPSSGYWSVLSVTAFQYDSDEDDDPDTELGTGGTSLASRNELALYLEVIHEEYGNISRIMAQELVNAAAIEDCEKPGCIMGDGHIFCDDCLDKIRDKGSSW